MGVYRMWRDAGYAVGAVVIGLVMARASLEWAFVVTGVAMLASGAVVFAWMEETHPCFGTHTPPTGGAKPSSPFGSRTEVTDR